MYSLINFNFNEKNLRSAKIDVYYKPNGDAPQANIDNPEEMLQIMKKMVNISSQEKIQKYVRRIICSAYLLQRKYFPEYITEKFEPEKIYERAVKCLDSMQSTIMRLQSENQMYKKRNLSPAPKTHDIERLPSEQSDLIFLDDLKTKSRRNNMNGATG
jgi:hypothetical protein